MVYFSEGLCKLFSIICLGFGIICMFLNAIPAEIAWFTFAIIWNQLKQNKQNKN